MAHAVIQTGGKQYRVTEGDKLDIDRINVEVGEDTKFDHVLAIVDGKATQVGEPLISGAAVIAEVIDQYRAPKVTSFKFKRRKGYHRTIGSRKHLTRVQIKSIAG